LFIVLLIFPVLILSVGISKLTLQIVNLYLMWTPGDEMFADSECIEVKEKIVADDFEEM
jgi:hypothetical protein